MNICINENPIYINPGPHNPVINIIMLLLYMLNIIININNFYSISYNYIIHQLIV